MPTVDCEVTADGELVLRPGPSVPAGSTLVWRRDGVEVPAGERLAEGSYDLCVAGGEPVYSGMRDTRALVDLPVPAAVRVQLPYRTADGGLAVRVWERSVHAEVVDVDLDEGVRVTGRLIGAALAGGATLLPGDVPVQALPDGRWTALLTAAPPGTSELWLRYAPDAEPVRVGRFLDDILDKAVAFVLPGSHGVQPFYTAENELSVRATG
jgi:hypothetical protein